MRHFGAGSAAELRQRIRAGDHSGPTAGFSPGFVQCNVVILPKEHAADFQRFCELNPQPCPLLAASEPGDPTIPALGDDLDIRTDVPRYCIYRDGVLESEVGNITDLWQDDFVTFVLGCSFSFEEALAEAGIKLRYVERQRNVSMYVTNCETIPSGPFHGKTVVSMRDLLEIDNEVATAVQVTSRFPRVHGTPIHVGDGTAIGIKDIEAPEYGDAPEIGENTSRVPVFWACGVTPQKAIENAKLPLVITHSPGHMLVTDLLNTSIQFSPEDTLAERDVGQKCSSPGLLGVESISDVVLKGDIRGMTAIVDQGHVPRASFRDAADLILSCARGVVLIATGFYIMKAAAPETDGPPGAVALGLALQRLGFTPVYVTDRYSRAAVAACAGADAQVINFPITSSEHSAEFARGLLAGLKPTLLVSVERCGLGKDGKYRNMLGVDFSDYNARIDALFELADVPSIGVADGGNEIGCGGLSSSGAIPAADPEKLKSPPCVTETTKLVVAAASNWGAYGIAAALALQTARPELLLSAADAWDLVGKCVKAGAVDGILHEKGLLSVDGRGEQADADCLNSLHKLLDTYLTRSE